MLRTHKHLSCLLAASSAAYLPTWLHQQPCRQLARGLLTLLPCRMPACQWSASHRSMPVYSTSALHCAFGTCTDCISCPKEVETTMRICCCNVALCCRASMLTLLAWQMMSHATSAGACSGWRSWGMRMETWWPTAFCGMAHLPPVVSHTLSCCH